MKLIISFMIFLLSRSTSAPANFFMKMYYQGYTPKVGLTQTDYHSMYIQYSLANDFDNTYATPTVETFNWLFDSSGAQSPNPKASKDQTQIEYTGQYYLPTISYVSNGSGGNKVELIYSRNPHGGGSPIIKSYVMYNIVATCAGNNATTPALKVTRLAMRIKYFYCLTEAENFLSNSDPNLGSGTGVKILHDGTTFASEGTISITNAGVTNTNLKSLITMNPIVECNGTP